MEAARHDRLVPTDDDVHPPPDWLATLSVDEIVSTKEVNGSKCSYAFLAGWETQTPFAKNQDYSIVRENAGGVNHRLLGLIVLSTVFGLGHHVDHVIRGNHIGWPVTAQVNPFTYSLVIYPVILIGLYLAWRDRVGARYWFVVALLGLAMLGGIHFGPWAIEPPHDIISPYRTTVFGYLAFAWLFGLLGTLLVTAVYAARQWRDVQPVR